MKTESVKTYDWMTDVRPELLKNLNELLVAKGIDPLTELHGGRFKDGKWVGYDVPDTNDYRNYWHAYLELWGERLFNDSYQSMWFNAHDLDEEWDYYKERLREWAAKVYKPTDPYWTDDLVDAMRRVVKEHFPYDEEVVFKWCW